MSDASSASRVLVTGSRDWDDVLKVLGVLTQVSLRFPGATLVHGACPDGADELARTIWTTWRFPEEPHPADWQRHHKRAGFIRNAEMVRLGADLCVAFFMPCSKPNCKDPEPHDSHGATHCAKMARAAGIEMIEVRRESP